MSQTALIELFRGKAAHADPVACVGDLSADVAARTIDGFPHSIWQLLSHMNYWMHYELQRIKGAAPAYPEHASGSWLPNAATPDEAAWNEAIAHFRELIDASICLAQSDPASLAREVAPAHAQQSQHASSVHAILWQLVAHNSYHTGQIATLRRCLGAWPPRAGGDSW